MQYHSILLPNGIRYIHVPSDRQVAHLALVVNAGTRDELPEESGIAHFIEHVLFKGTKKRKAYHILSRLEDVGGEIDAFTSKEDTVISTSFLKQYFERSAELLFDILSNSIFPQKELEKEKDVILDEINSYYDSPSEQIYDDFEHHLFKGHELGQLILGSEAFLEKFTKEDILKFMKRTYNTDQMVICSIGDIAITKAQKIIDKYFAQIPENHRQWKRNQFTTYQTFLLKQEQKTYQAHGIIGNLAYHSFDEKRKTLLLLNNILGGPGLNSRLNLVLREKYGWVYNIESNYSQYSDSGIWSVYFGTDKKNFDKVLRTIKKEMQEMINQKLGPKQLQKAKQQIIGQMALSSENNQDMLIGIAKSFMLYGKLDNFETIKQTVNEISSQKLQDVAAEIFAPKELSLLAYI